MHDAEGERRDLPVPPILFISSTFTAFKQYYTKKMRNKYMEIKSGPGHSPSVIRR